MFSFKAIVHLSNYLISSWYCNSLFYRTTIFLLLFEIMISFFSASDFSLFICSSIYWRVEWDSRSCISYPSTFFFLYSTWMIELFNSSMTVYFSFSTIFRVYFSDLCRFISYFNRLISMLLLLIYFISTFFSLFYFDILVESPSLKSSSSHCLLE